MCVEDPFLQIQIVEKQVVKQGRLPTPEDMLNP